MRRLSVIAAVSLAVQGIVPEAVAQTAAPPLSGAPTTSSAGWQVGHFDGLCMLVRAFGSGNNQITAGVVPDLLRSDIARLIIVAPVDTTTRGAGTADVALDDRAVAETRFEAFGILAPRGRLIMISGDALEVAALRRASVATIHADAVQGRLRLAGLAEAWPQLERCVDQRRVELRIDPALLHPATEAHATRPATNWLTSDDYPAAALSAGVGARSTILWTVGIDGRVRDCRTVGSTVAPIFEQSACRALSLRGRFTPARDASDRPVESYQERVIRWSMPG